LNSFLVYRQFKWRALTTLPIWWSPGVWMAEINLRDGYFTVPLHQVDRHLLQFRWGRGGSKGKSLFQRCPALVICSDVSLSYWGVVCGGGGW
jgi:hypothetical protein